MFVRSHPGHSVSAVRDKTKATQASPKTGRAEAKLGQNIAAVEFYFHVIPLQQSDN